MGDWYDVILTVDLQPDVPPAELAELRWHLGLGDRPADRIGGVLGAELVPRDDGGWALSVRQELHPDELDPVHQLIAWLAQHADVTRSGNHLGSIRFYEDNQTEPLVIHNDQPYRGNTPLT